MNCVCPQYAMARRYETAAVVCDAQGPSLGFVFFHISIAVAILDPAPSKLYPNRRIVTSCRVRHFYSKVFQSSSQL